MFFKEITKNFYWGKPLTRLIQLRNMSSYVIVCLFVYYYYYY